jgi:hypothetical protein
MSETTAFSFICPVCGHDEIEEVWFSRTYITIEPFLQRIDDEDSSEFLTEMKEEHTELNEDGEAIIGYNCQCCGMELRIDEEFETPVTTPTDLYNWLREHNMLGEVMDRSLPCLQRRYTRLRFE